MDLLFGAATSWWSPLPVFIFFAEMAVITLDTIRTIFIARGRKALASSMGLLEVSIWLFAISQVLQNLSNVACFAGYAAGFTAGTFLGIGIEEKLALGTLGIRIITNKDASDLISSLRKASFGVTTIDAQGTSGPVDVIFTLIKRHQLQHVIRIIERADPTIFYFVEDLRSANGGVFQIPQSQAQGAVRTPLPLFKIDNTRPYLPLSNLLAAVRRRLGRIAGCCISPLRVQNLQARAETVQLTGEVGADLAGRLHAEHMSEQLLSLGDGR